MKDIIGFLGSLFVFIILIQCVKDESINLNGILANTWDVVSGMVTGVSNSNYQPPTQAPLQSTQPNTKQQ